jgi:hypothetical protein
MFSRLLTPSRRARSNGSFERNALQRAAVETFCWLVKTTKTAPDGEHVKAKVLAKRYNVTEATIYNWAKSGKIPSVSFCGVIRFDMEAVRAVIEGGAA